MRVPLTVALGRGPAELSQVICIKDKVEVLSRLSKVSNSQWIVSPQQKELFDLESSKEASATTSPHLTGDQSGFSKQGLQSPLFNFPHGHH